MTDRVRKKDGEPKKKQWDSINALPGTNDVLKQIALDEHKYVYRLIDDLLKEKYPKYFRNHKKNAV